MNFSHLKYAAEVARCRSISKAAENLYMNQPNLSRAVKELEESLGITIFNRTTKGITITPQGEEFLVYANKILNQVAEVEAIYKNKEQKKRRFSVCVPRASYVCEAFADFVAEVENSGDIEFYYKEANTERTMAEVFQSDCDLGIIRCLKSIDGSWEGLLEEKSLGYELIKEFSYSALMSKDDPLAVKESLTLDDLKDYTEIAHADSYIPSAPFSVVRREDGGCIAGKRVYVYERASRFSLLERVEHSFMAVSPTPKHLLEKYGLTEVPLENKGRIYTDVLIYRKGYKLSELDKMFIEKLKNA